MATPNVLLCDRHSVVRLGERTALNGTAKIVGEASNGNDAVNLCAKLRPNIAIVGSQFADLDGIPVAAKILALGCGTRVIMVSAVDNPRVIEQMYSLNVHGYITKDTDIQKLPEAVKSVAAGQKWYDEVVSAVMEQFAPCTVWGKPDNTLTEREVEVVYSWAVGDSAKVTAKKLGISEKTVARHRDSIHRKLKGWNRNRDVTQADITRYVQELGWLRGEDA